MDWDGEIIMHYLLSVGISLYERSRRTSEQTLKVLVLEQALAGAGGSLSSPHRLLLVLDWKGDGHGLVDRGVWLKQRSLAQTLDLELLRNLEEGLEAVLGDVNLAEVDEVHQRGQVIGPHVREEEDGMLCGMNGAQQLGEVTRARAQDDAVRLDSRALAR